MPDPAPITAGSRTGLHATVGPFIENLNGFLDDMKAYLIACGLTIPIFTGFQPPAPDTCVTLYEYAGQPPATHGIDLEIPGLQARIRQAVGTRDYQAGKMIAEDITAALHDKKNFATGRTHYIHIMAQQSVFSLPRDENNRVEFTINFLVKKRKL